MPNFDFFTNLAKENLTPKGSITPHPREWKGNKHQKTTTVVQTLTPDRLQVVDDLRPIMSSVGSKRTPHPKRAPFRRSLTKKQQSLAHYLVQGYSKRQAMLRSGYSEKSASRHTFNASNIKTVVDYLENMKEKLRAQGITDDYIAKKFKGWFEAEKKVGKEEYMPDHEVQMKAYDRYEKIINPVKTTSDGMVKKREISLSEWIKE